MKRKPKNKKEMEILSNNVKYSDVRPREGGPYSLFCYTCRRWIPNTANHEMKKEGCFAHNHFCYEKNGKLVICREEGIPEEQVARKAADASK